MPKILILSSNPRRDLNLEREVSDLTTAVQRLGKFEIGLGLGVRPQELPELLTKHSPQIVHFCGHGAGEQGLVFQNEHGHERLVSTEVLVRLFKTFQDDVNCVVLNACDSDRQAAAIVTYIDYAVGMSQPIIDQAAYIFAVGFYKGLAAGKSVEQAYELGCLAIQIWSEDNAHATQSRQYRKAEYAGAIAQPIQPHLPEHLKPVLRKKSLLSSRGSSAAQVSPLTAALPSGFEVGVRQEIDRKEYKDQARAAYENFGHFSAENAVDLTKKESEQRKIVVGKVKSFWIEGFLKPSLQGADALRLDLEDRPDAIADLSQGIEALSVELDDSYEELRETQIYQEMGQGRTLLILGNPGAGKTIALLQLAQRLLDRSEQNLSLPMPVVFNLSSWAKDRKSIVDWLIDELREKYQVPKSLSKPWITQQQLILLLDGLDEVKDEYRDDCVRSLNQFIGLFPQTEMAVCSRVQDYESLTERLQISSALCLQPLSSKQVYEFLNRVGGSLAGLKALLKRDADLEQFAQTPLILNLMSSAYQGWPVEKLIQELRSTTNRNQHLFDTYIDRRLERGDTSEYSKGQVVHWLNWLASKMVQQRQTIFLIEKLQPTWLGHRNEKKAYRIKTFMLSALLAGPIVGLSNVIDHIAVKSPYSVMIPDSFQVTLVFAMISGIFVGLLQEITPLEELSWSWQRAKSRLVRELSVGFGYGLIGGVIYGLVALNGDELISCGISYGLISGLLFLLGSGLCSSEIKQRTVPNQGIRSSLSNCLIIGLITALIAWLTAFLIAKSFYPLIFVLTAGVIGGLIGVRYGGIACVQHFALRQMLHRTGRIPWNYAKFLDFAAERLLMKKVGGGYVFFHRMLLEHFARMNSTEVS